MLNQLSKDETPENGEETLTGKPLTPEQITALEFERAEIRNRGSEITQIVKALEIELDDAKARYYHRVAGSPAEVADLERKINEHRAEDTQIEARELEIMREISATTAPADWRADAAQRFGFTPAQAAQLEGKTPAEIHEHAQKFAASLAKATPGAPVHSFSKLSDVAW